MFDLSGKVALVTGAGQGVGEGIARALAAQGARVYVNDLRAERADETVARLRDGGAEAEPVPFDVTDLDAVLAAVGGIDPVDILVNNAGNGGAEAMQPKQFRDMTPDDWKGPVDVNLWGVFNGIHAVLPGMCDRGFGRIITISSGAGCVGIPIGVSPYGAGKSGAIGLMRHVAVENARLGVTANSLALGLMQPPDHRGVTDSLARQIPVGRTGTGDDIGPLCVYLASDEASWMTGQTIHINGGSITS